MCGRSITFIPITFIPMTRNGMFHLLLMGCCDPLRQRQGEVLSDEVLSMGRASWWVALR